MPQSKTIKDLVKTLSILSIISLAIFLLFPTFKSKAEGDPELKDLVLSTETVNTYDGEGEQTVTIWARLSTGTETLIEIETATVTVEPPPYSHPRSLVEEMTLEVGDCSGIGIDTEGITDCGTAADGIYKAEVTFPKPSLQGEWGVAIDYVDAESNTMDWPASITGAYITNQTSTEDTTAPEIESWYFEPETINTESTDVEVTMYLRLSDDISGLPTSYNPSITLQAIDSSLPNNSRYTVDFELEIMTDDDACVLLDANFMDGLTNCGDEMDGIYTGTATLPKYSPKGMWKVGINNQDSWLGSIDLSDTAENRLSLSTDPTIDISFTNSASTHDVTSPVLKNVTMTPSSFNSNLGDVEITIKMEVEDDLSGVKTANVNLKPLAGGEGIDVTEELEETVTDGVITFTATIPQHSKTGLWVVEGLSITDSISNNYAVWGFRNLSFTFPDLELFLVNQAITDEVLIEEDWYLEEWDNYIPGFYLTHPLMSIKFEEGTVVTKKEGGSFAFHRMLSRKYDMEQYNNINALIQLANEQLSNDLQECDASEGCFNSLLNTNNLTGQPVNLIKIGIPGLNLSFSKPVTITIAVEDQYLGTTFIVQTFNHETDEWEDETTCLVATVEPSSYEHGGGEDGFFKPAPYTACQFQIDHASFFSTNILGESTTEAGVPNTGIGGPLNFLRKWLR